MIKRLFMLMAAVLLMSASVMAQSVTPKKADVNGDKVVDAAKKHDVAKEKAAEKVPADALTEKKAKAATKAKKAAAKK